MIYDEKIAAEFGVTAAEYAVLLTVGYEVPLPKNRFVPHAVWEALGVVTENQVSEAFEVCLSKGWITLTEYDHPEFTVEGKKLWADICLAVMKWNTEMKAIRDEENRRKDASQEAERLAGRKWSQDLGQNSFSCPNE